MEAFYKCIDWMKCKQRGAAALCMDQVDSCVCIYACVCKCVSEQIHVSMIACVSKHTCVHLNVFVFTVYMYMCVSVSTK